MTYLNPAPPRILHLDLNSAFAAIEQQANPLLRGVPLAIAASTQPFGCILASSREAKLWGIKTGMSVAEGRTHCPFLVIRPADPNKYRYVHTQIKTLLTRYTDHLIPKSIDEFVLDLSHLPTQTVLIDSAKKIQNEIKGRVGEWLTVSVGVGPNRFLAKLGSDLKSQEPTIIDHTNLTRIYAPLSLTDLSGINWRLAARLNAQTIFTPLDFLHADSLRLQAVFHSVLARDWYLRLRGWELDNWSSIRKSFGQSYVLPHSMEQNKWLPILVKLVNKATRRMRQAGYSARGVKLSLRFANHSHFHQRQTFANPLFTTSSLLKALRSLLPSHSLPVKKIAVTCFQLSPLHSYQCSLLEPTPVRHSLSLVVDSVNAHYGNYTLHPASMLNTGSYVRDAIAFGQ